MNRKERRAANKNKKNNGSASPTLNPNMSLEDIQREQIIQKAFTNATELQKIGKFEDAQKLYRLILEQEPTHAGTLHHIGLLTKESEEENALETAESFIKMALESMPDYYQAWNSLGTVQREANKRENALQSYDKCLKINPQYADAIANKANVLWDINRFDEAALLYKKSIKIDSTNPEAHLALGNIYRTNGEIIKAENHIRQAISIQPDLIKAYYSLSQIKIFTPDDPDLKALEKLENKIDSISCKETEKGELFFSLGKAYQDIGDYDLAFKKFEKANDIIRKTFEYSSKIIDSYFKNIPSILTTEILNNFEDEGLETDKPIFIVGMPRSGASLIEKILSSQSEVTQAGELTAFNDIISEAINQNMEVDLRIINQELIKKLSPQMLKSCGKKYIDSLSTYAPDAKYITDKMTTSFISIGLIKLIFPNTKIIHCERDPIDTCLSCYTSYFQGISSWSHTLEEIGLFYNSYRELMDYWKSIFNDQIYNISYEALVNNTEEETAKLLEYCKIKYDDKQQSIPIHKNSIGKWKKYEEQLKPLIEILEEYKPAKKTREITI